MAAGEVRRRGKDKVSQPPGECCGDPLGGDGREQAASGRLLRDPWAIRTSAKGELEAERSEQLRECTRPMGQEELVGRGLALVRGEMGPQGCGREASVGHRDEKSLGKKVSCNGHQVGRAGDRAAGCTASRRAGQEGKNFRAHRPARGLRAVRALGEGQVEWAGAGVPRYPACCCEGQNSG